jgi:hypothetical protein
MELGITTAELRNDVPCRVVKNYAMYLNGVLSCQVEVSPLEEAEGQPGPGEQESSLVDPENAADIGLRGRKALLAVLPGLLGSA